MVFSSVTFLFYFLPLTLIVYYLSPQRMRTIVLLLFSLLFYVLTAGQYVILLMLSALFNFVIGKRMRGQKNKWMLYASLLINLCILLFFHAPGVSFFSFQAIAYQVDVYNGKIHEEQNLLSWLLYFTFFAKVTAGPIVRYREMGERRETRELFTAGIMRFVIGLFYKCVLADTLLAITGVFTGNTMLSAWLSAIASLLYIAFDFIGYSDMAIGIGMFFGYQFPENFNYPLMANSIRDFWRRWHMTLMRFFKDYVYIPLGGSRRSVIRNIFVVWVLTGLWHGREWNYLLWGLYFGLFVVLERCVYGTWLKQHKVVSHFYTLFVVLIGFVFFTGNDVSHIGSLLEAMAGIGVPLVDALSMYYALSYLPFMSFAFLCGTPLFSRLYHALCDRWQYAEVVVMAVLFVVSVSFMLQGGFTPFVYFRY